MLIPYRSPSRDLGMEKAGKSINMAKDKAPICGNDGE